MSFHAPWHDATGHRQRVDQEPLGTPHQRKGISVELAIIQELVARRALEAGYLEQQLREVWQWRIVGAEKHHRRPRDLVAIDQQAQPAQDLQRLARTRVVHPAAADGLLQRQHHLAPVQATDIPPGSRPVLPALGGVHLLQQQALVGLARHHAGGVEHPLIGHAAKGDRRARRARRGKHQHLVDIVDAHALDRWKQRRLEGLELLRQFFQSAVGDRLTHDLACRCDAEQHSTTLTVGEGAEGSASAFFFGGGFREFDRGGFTGSGAGPDHLDRGAHPDHGASSRAMSPDGDRPDGSRSDSVGSLRKAGPSFRSATRSTYTVCRFSQSSGPVPKK